MRGLQLCPWQGCGEGVHSWPGREGGGWFFEGSVFLNPLLRVVGCGQAREEYVL